MPSSLHAQDNAILCIGVQPAVQQQSSVCLRCVSLGSTSFCQVSYMHCAEDDRWLGKPPLHAIVRVFQMSFFRKIITRHDTGLGEAYMDDDYEVRTIAPSLPNWG